MLEKKKQAEIARYEKQRERLEDQRRRRESAELDRLIKEAQQGVKGARQRGDAREDRAERIQHILENGGDWSKLDPADQEFILRHAKVK